MEGSAALQSAATAFSLSSVPSQGKPHWHADLGLLGELGSYETLDSYKP